ncbi:putative Dynein heavy chain 6, axonemal [Cardiosporidium cionae]|uniref:Dynein heavy chain 6, axonemal n=1 Tax=Cardiosporidium cionae TaxID=476202 RepID=A0ABQ7JDA0_9APIC|nr:putative Dynein heavy chain 6, axonemal [Cardiosporidium cionae]|eukprot:KAF8821951.1 putative Dynein heavy chain 6, axonemal [Cardiosporidium cionae]
MEVVNTLLEEKTDWDSAKKVLSESGFLQRLKNFERDYISPPLLRKLERYLSKPDFSPEKVGSHSLAAKSLCMWAHAIGKYFQVLKEVKPKRDRLKEMDKQLSEANFQLESAQKKLNEALETIRLLHAQLEETNAEKQRLLQEADLCRLRIQRAETITQRLADEHVKSIIL